METDTKGRKIMDSHQVTFTYLNIRQSIAILLTKIILVDLVLAVIIVGFYWVLVIGEGFLNTIFTGSSLFLIIFGVTGLLKILLSVYIVLQWLNEYYEITPEYIYHKRGIIFRKTEEYRIDHIRRVEVQDSFLGELFNFATLTLYDIRLNKYLDLYLIHNPRRYTRVLKELNPEIETEKDHIRLPFMPKEENNVEAT